MVKTKLTPIRTPGGKSNALKFLDPYFIKDFKEYREPFLGGGSVGLYLMQINKNATYWINDFCYPVYCFWKTLYDKPEEMVHFLSAEKAFHSAMDDEIGKRVNGKKIPSKSAENGRALHTKCRAAITQTIENRDIYQTGCLWYILNKLSYSGMSMIGSYAPLAWDQNFTSNCIKNLPKTSELMHSVRVNITWLDYTELLGNQGDEVFIFLDPPYKIPHSLYGDKGDMHRKFDHLKFSTDIKQCTSHKWMITYNQDEHITEWFKDYPQIPWDLQYTMKAAKRVGQEGSETTGKSGKQGKELLIMNYDIKPQDNSSILL
jgi:DNA adenine methylase